jgi:hypothetical protein
MGDWKMLKERFSLIKQKGLKEGRRLLWIFVYLWVLLGLFAAHKSIVLNDPDFFYHQGFAFINAWLLAKVMLTAEMLHIADSLKHRPVIYPIVLKSAVFSTILISFYLIEEVLVGMWHGKTVTESLPAIGGGGLEGILVVGIIMFVVLMPFFALGEIARDIGDGKLYELFFVRRTKYVPLQS